MPLRPSTAFASTFLELSVCPFVVAIAFSNYCRTLPQVILQQTCTLTGRKSPYEGYRSVSVSSVWELNQAFSRSPELREVLWKVLLQAQSGFQPEPEQAVRLRKEAKCAFFLCACPLPMTRLVCLWYESGSSIASTLSSHRASPRPFRPTPAHRVVGGHNREYGRNPRCQLLLEASSQLFSSGRHPGSHQL